MAAVAAPTLVILATSDAALADAWERQLPAGRVALRLSAQAFPVGTAPGFAAVIVLDAVAEVSGGMPLIIPTDPRYVTVEDLLDCCDGFILRRFMWR